MSEAELIRDDKPQQALQTLPPAPLALAGVNIEALLEKALTAESAVEVLERLMVMRREMKAESAKETFDHALAEFQAECPVIKKEQQIYDKQNKPRYRFAPLDSIVGQTKALLRKHGFSYSLTAAVEPQWVTAILTVKHSQGHSERSEFKIPIDPDAYMSAPQKFGSALTFAKRYAFCNGFGILTGDYDDDAHESDPVHAAGQDKRAPAPTPHTQAPAPAPAAKPAAATPPPAEKAVVHPFKLATAVTRTWALGELIGTDDLAPDREKFLLEFLRKAGCLMPNEPLDAWPLQYVPVASEQLKQVRAALSGFENGGAAKFPFYNEGHQVAEDKPKEKPPTQVAAKPVEVPRDGGDAWRVFIMPIGKKVKGMRMGDVEKESLHWFWENIKVEETYNGRPLKPETIEATKRFRAMLDAAGQFYGWFMEEPQ